jgi:hypothetical protein
MAKRRPTQRCPQCSLEFVRRTDWVYDLDDEHGLCFECAMRRGGEYDCASNIWRVAPDVSDLLASRRDAR